MRTLTDQFRTYFQPATTTAKEVGQYTSEAAVNAILSRVSTSGYPGLGKLCYVYGGGGLPESSYRNLLGQIGLQVIFFESVLPRGLRFMASYRGLVRIDEPSVIVNVVDKLTEQSMVVVFVFDATLESSFLECVRNDKRRDPGCGVKADPGYLLYVVDADRYDSPTGMFHFLSCGSDGPWIELFSEMTEAE